MRESVVGDAGGWGWNRVAGALAGVDPTTLLATSGPVRAALAFLLVAGFGGLLVRRRGGFLDRSVDATTARPLAAIAYGVAAHLLIAFAGVYLTTRLGQVEVAGVNASSLGVVVLAVLVLSAGVLGFTVVGATLVDVWGGRGEWAGPVVGAVVAGAVTVVEPAVGAIGWLLVVSVGIGGPFRRWIHASAVDL